MGKDIKLTASDNFQLGGYRADPAAPPKAAIVVIQEIFGVNHHIRAVCDRFADEGYVAIAPSIFDRVERNFQCGYSPEEVAVARKFVANPDWAALLRDTQAAIDAVKDVGPVGIIGDSVTSFMYLFSMNVALLPDTFQARQLVMRLPAWSGLAMGR